MFPAIRPPLVQVKTGIVNGAISLHGEKKWFLRVKISYLFMYDTDIHTVYTQIYYIFVVLKFHGQEGNNAKKIV